MEVNVVRQIVEVAAFLILAIAGGWSLAHVVTARTTIARLLAATGAVACVAVFAWIVWA